MDPLAVLAHGAEQALPSLEHGALTSRLVWEN